MAFLGCEGVTAEPSYCLTFTESGPALIGLESGSICSIISASPEQTFRPTSLSWRGEVVYFCDWDLFRISLRDGSWEPLPAECEGVTDYGGGLLTWRERRQQWPLELALRWYPDSNALLGGAPAATFPIAEDVGESVEAIAAHGGRWYGAPGFGDRIYVADLTAGASGDFIPLEGYRDWISGISILGDGYLIVTDGFARLTALDAATGSREREIALLEETEHSGLSCVTRNAVPSGASARAMGQRGTPRSPCCCNPLCGTCTPVWGCCTRRCSRRATLRFSKQMTTRREPT